MLYCHVASRFRELARELALEQALSGPPEQLGELVVGEQDRVELLMRSGRHDRREVRSWSRGAVRWILKLAWSAAGTSSAEAEAATLQEMQRRGIRVPEVVAMATREDGFSVLVLEEISGTVLSQRITAVEDRALRDLLRATAHAVGALHEAGIVHGQLFARHLMIAADGVFVLDPRAVRMQRPGRPLGPRRRARDLAALFASLPRGLTARSRQRLLRDAGLDGPGRRRVQAWIDAGERQCRRNGVHLRTDGFRILRHPQGWVAARDPRPDLPAVFDASPDGSLEIVRRRDRRENLRWRSPPGARPDSVWFGKRFRAGPGTPHAVREWLRHGILERMGVGVSSVVAVMGSLDGRSAIFTAAVEPGTTLRDRLHNLPATGWRQRRRWCRELAGVVRRMHRWGLFHRDLYLDHFLERDDGSLVLIDLERMEDRGPGSVRLRIKDLAALEYSSRTAAVPASERLRFLRHYAGKDRRLLRAVVRKADRIQERERRKGRFPVARPPG